ncbi:MAG TPA: histidine kinase [Parafilimonas sp.]|nr:histidine kinase [Parafilimonas sp.]
MQNTAIEHFYFFFQGVIIFQVIVFFVLFIITGKKDILYYSLFLFFATIYFFLNAPNTFFGIPEETVWNSALYHYSNIPIIITENLFYILFLKTFFIDVTSDDTLKNFFSFILYVIPLLMIVFITLVLFNINDQTIYYTVKMTAVVPTMAVVYVLFKRKPPFTNLIVKGLICTIAGTCTTVCMIALGNNGVHSLFTSDYPLFFIRLGILGDMIFYLTAILKKWHFQEKQFAIQMLNERLRISRELHDDIGSTLGSISIYSEVAKNRSEKNENAEEAIAKIGSASRELIDKMSDIVWSVNPNNESFEQLQNRMQAFAAVMLTAHEIIYTINVGEQVKKLELKTEERKNIYLIYKEAIHNIIKYASCSQVEINMLLDDDEFILQVRDNGKGFNVNNILQATESLGGNGIKNMLARAENINGKLSIDSLMNAGTTIGLKLKV